MAQANARPWFIVCFGVLALLGAVDGAYLTLVHLDYATGAVQPGASLCHALAAHGCQVTAGRFGSVGPFPVALLGASYALSLLVPTWRAWKRRGDIYDESADALLLVSVPCVLASIIMGALSLLEASFCPFCVLWYGLNFALVVCAWPLRARHDRVRDRLIDVWDAHATAMMVTFGLALAAGTFGYHTTKRARIETARQELYAHAAEFAEEFLQKARKKTPVELTLSPTVPSRGNRDAPLQLVEFADFECPHCKTLFDAVTAYSQAHPDALRVRFLHFPLDASCNDAAQTVHAHACAAAYAALCAHEQGQFWSYGTLLFEHQRDLDASDLQSYAEQLGLDLGAFQRCLDAPDTKAKLARDLATAQSIGLRATPTFVVNGILFEAGLPEPLLAALLDKLR